MLSAFQPVVGFAPDQGGDRRVQLGLQSVTRVRSRRQDRTRARRAVHREVDSRLTHGADNVVLDRIERPHAASHVAELPVERIGNLANRVRGHTAHPIHDAAQAAPPLDRIVVDDQPQGTGVVGVDPKGELCVPRRRTEGGGRCPTQLGQVRIESIPIRLEGSVVNKVVHHYRVEDFGKLRVVRQFLGSEGRGDSDGCREDAQKSHRPTSGVERAWNLKPSLRATTGIRLRARNKPAAIHSRTLASRPACVEPNTSASAKNV